MGKIPLGWLICFNIVSIRSVCLNIVHFKSACSQKRQTKFKISSKTWKIDFAHTFKLESVMSLGSHGIVCFVKYCFILEKNTNYRTPLKVSIRPRPY